MASKIEFSIKGEFGFCTECGRALEESSETGTCDAVQSCRERAQFAIEQELIDSARIDAARLWAPTLF